MSNSNIFVTKVLVSLSGGSSHHSYVHQVTLSPVMGTTVAVKLEWSGPRHSASSLFCLAPDRTRELKELRLIHCYGNTKFTQGPCLYWCGWEDVLPLHQEGSPQEADLHLKPPLMSGQTQAGDKAALGQAPAALETSPVHMDKVCWHTELHMAISNKIMLCTCKVDPIFLEFGHIISSFFFVKKPLRTCAP